MKFADLNLDYQLLKNVTKNGWDLLFPAQEESLPYSLKGKDLFIRAKTGSGKTAIYLITIIENSISYYKKQDAKNKLFAIVLLPTNDLAFQVTSLFSIFLRKRQDTTNVINLCEKSIQDRIQNQPKQLEFLLEETANNVLIGTPKNVLAFIDANMKKSVKSLLSHLQTIIYDEADLLFGYGYNEDIEKLNSMLPKGCQHLILSATLDDSIKKLCDETVNDAIVIKPKEGIIPSEDKLKQYTVKCENEDRYLIMYTLIKLNLLKGRFLIFANQGNVAYKLQIFFLRFNITCGVLSGELPFNSRYEIVESFNAGKFNILIATDDSSIIFKMDESKKDKEFSVSRGIDFFKVDYVINFDCPNNVDSYIHRIGRTARANQDGMALTFLNSYEDQITIDKFEEYFIRNGVLNSEKLIKPFLFKIELVEGFRYRVNDVLKDINKKKIFEMKRNEIRQQVLKSKKLEEHFKLHPQDKIALKGFNKSNNSFTRSLNTIPSYLVPLSLKHSINTIEMNIGEIRRVKKSKYKHRKGKNALKTYKTKK